VLKAAEELNYSPNIAARYLKTRKTGQIMLSVSYMPDEFYIEMITATQDVAKRNGYSLLIENTEDDALEEIRVIKNAKRNFVDGLIMASLDFSKKHIEEMKKLDKPVILINICNNKIDYKKESLDYIGADTKKGIYLSTKHLIDQGHTSIGFVGLDLNTQTGYERREGFLLAMKESAVPIREDYIITGKFGTGFGYEAGLAFARMDDPPTAICASADLLALGLYRAFEQERVNIPEDISIIGMDNISTSRLITPKLSTVALSQKEIGRYAAELIFERLNKSAKPYRNIIFKPKLIVRESSIKVYST
jgi:LacI family transcriptional regulator